MGKWLLRDSSEEEDRAGYISFFIALALSVPIGILTWLIQVIIFQEEGNLYIGVIVGMITFFIIWISLFIYLWAKFKRMGVIVLKEVLNIAPIIIIFFILCCSILLIILFAIHFLWMISILTGTLFVSFLFPKKMEANKLKQERERLEGLGSKMMVPIIVKEDTQFLEEKKKRESDLRAKKQLEKETKTIEKIKTMLEVSTRISLNRMQIALKMDDLSFNNKIFDWAKKFGFTIDGDYLIINKDTVSEFIEMLDKQFVTWDQNKAKK